MPLEDYKNIITDTKDYIFQVALGGRGDPDMHENFEEILRYTRENNVVPNFTTSGLGMTPEKAQICKKYCSAVAISMYSRLNTRPELALRRVHSENSKKVYKDVEDIQKRIAQMHSPGIRPNVDAVDFEGNRVSDGFHRALVFADFEDVISNVIDNITVICDRRIEIAKANLKEGKETSVELEEAKAFKELLVGKNGLYRQINATDAQAYSCASSYRKKAFMFGKWSRSAEAVYHKLKKGEYVSMSDIHTAFQPLKPFVYSQIAKSSGVKDAPMSKLKVGIQNKNSEYLLIMAEALIQNEDTGKPNLLRAINEFMEETADRFPTRGIDTIVKTVENATVFDA
jgi:hypothetical protein